MGIGFVVLVIIWVGFFVALTFNGGLNSKNGFVGVRKTPEEIAAMLAKVKARQARYDRWIASLDNRWGKKSDR